MACTLLLDGGVHVRCSFAVSIALAALAAACNDAAGGHASSDASDATAPIDGDSVDVGTEARQDAAADGGTMDAPDGMPATSEAGWCSGEAGPGGTPYCFPDADTWCCLPQGTIFRACPPSTSQGVSCEYDGGPYDGGCYQCPGGGGGQSVGEGCECGFLIAGDGGLIWACGSAQNVCPGP